MELPPELKRAVDEERAIVRLGFPWWLSPLLLRGVAGIVLGRHIFLDRAIADLPRALRHELAHVRQIRRLGLFNFYWQWLREYIGNRRRGWPPAEAYRRISLELEAFEAERDV